MSDTPHVCFRKLDPQQNMKRYNCILLTKPLFDEWCIVRTWGRLDREQTRRLTVACEREARILFDRLAKNRHARKYHIIDGANAASARIGV